MTGFPPKDQTLLAAKNAVLASIDASSDPIDVEIERMRSNMETGLRALIVAARGGDQQAVKKLRIMCSGATSNTAEATRLALMGHDERRHYLAQKRQRASRIREARAKQDRREKKKKARR